MPFHHYLRDHFRRNKHFGSSDRRFYKNACYAFWRYAMPGSPITESHIINALQLSGNYPAQWPDMGELLSEFQSEHKEPTFGTFPLGQFSSGISEDEYVSWFRLVPPIYLHSPALKRTELEAFLRKKSIVFQRIESHYTVEYSPVLQEAIDNGLCRIQDLGSVHSLHNLPVSKGNTIWDCCAGAGGKSIALIEKYPESELFCSDKRESAIQNLKNRFKLLHLPCPVSAVFDLEKMPENPWNKRFDLVLLDAPCSGSGTWRHNPENLHFYSAEKIKDVSELQLRLLRNAWQSVKSGGTLVYITCSVMEAENEGVVRQFAENTEINSFETSIHGGTKENADYFFRAVISKPYLGS